MEEFILPDLKGGVCYSDLDYKLRDNQSPDMNNMWFDARCLNKRWGQLTDCTNLNGPVHAWHNDLLNGMGIFHAGVSLYSYDFANSTATTIANSIANSSGTFFAYQENLYYLDGTNFWMINDKFEVDTVDPYVPVVLTGCTPNLSTSSAYEDYNMIGAGFTVWYNASGTNIYSLPAFSAQANYIGSGTNYTYKLYSQRKAAVCFSAAANGAVNANLSTTVKLKIGGVGASDLSLQYYDDNGGAPGNSITNSYAVNTATLTNKMAEYTYQLPLTTNMVVGARYWLVATSTNGDATNYFEWRQFSTGGTPAVHTSYNNSGTWAAQAKYTAYFKSSIAKMVLDATTPKVEINGVDTEDFTYDQTNGTVTFTVAPTNDGILNGIKITAYSTDATAAGKIKGCTLAIPFGGEGSGVVGGTRIIASGNPEHPTTYWRSGLKDPTYWPETEYDLLDNNDQAIKAFGKQYGNLIVLKEKSIYNIGYDFDGTNTRWPTKEVHAGIGCDMPGSVQLIDNRLVFFNSDTGGYIIDRTDQTSESNVKPISGNIDGTIINPGILAESTSDLQACTSIDFGRKYWLCLPNGKAYIWDYNISPYYDNGDYADAMSRLSWFPFTNIYAGAFFGYGQTLYYGRTDEGSITKFTDDFADYGAAISAYWQSKAFDFNYPQYLKTVSEVIIGLRTDTNTAITIEYLDERKEKVDSTTVTAGSFSWENFSWEVFTWQYYRYAKQIRRRPKRKKIVYFAIKISNAQLSRDMGITDVSIYFEKNRRVK